MSGLGFAVDAILERQITGGKKGSPAHPVSLPQSKAKPNARGIYRKARRPLGLRLEAQTLRGTHRKHFPDNLERALDKAIQTAR